MQSAMLPLPPITSNDRPFGCQIICTDILTMVTLISDITTATSRARQRNEVV